MRYPLLLIMGLAGILAQGCACPRPAASGKSAAAAAPSELSPTAQADTTPTSVPLKEIRPDHGMNGARAGGLGGASEFMK